MPSVNRSDLAVGATPTGSTSRRAPLRDFLAELGRAMVARQQSPFRSVSLATNTVAADRASTMPTGQRASSVGPEPLAASGTRKRDRASTQPRGVVPEQADRPGTIAPPSSRPSPPAGSAARVPSDADVLGRLTGTKDPATSTTSAARSGGILPGAPPIASKALGGVGWRLEDYPRPPGDTGRGFHWIPTLRSEPAVVDRFVDEAKKMGASWVVFLNDGTRTGDNDYLVKRLVENGIEPVMRIYTHRGEPITGDLVGTVRHYVKLGVRYFQPYNEPNLPEENPDGRVSVQSYLDRWIPAARAIVAGGGLPGLGALAPAAPVDDVDFLRRSLQGIRARGAGDLLDRAWISMHNYTFNRPIDYADDSNGFLKFRWYDQVVRAEVGRSLPIIGTEGGPVLGSHHDPRFAPVDAARRDRLAVEAFQYLHGREPYLFAHTQWVLANEAGGGHDPAWRNHSLFHPDGSPTTLVQQLRTMEVGA